MLRSRPVQSKSPDPRGAGMRSSIGAAVTLFLCTCSPVLPPESADPAGLVRGGSLVVDAPRLRSLDPLQATDVNSSSIAGEIMEGLVGYSPWDLHEIVPVLARDWSVSEDRREWTFRLRSEARFHDAPCFPAGRGRRITADDVRYSIERSLRHGRETVASSLRRLIAGADAYATEASDTVEGLEVLDPATIRFTLVRPGSAFLHGLASVAGWVVPHEAVEHYGSGFERQPVGTGPFRLGSWTEEALTLVRNEGYWRRDAEGRRLPYLDRIVLRSPRSIRRDDQSFSDLLDGSLHVLYFTGEIDWIQFAPLAALMERRGIRSESISKWNTIYYAWNMARGEVWSRARDVRRAIALAVRRPEPGQLLEPAGGLLPPGIPGCGTDRAPRERDLAQAKRLLADAGFPEGRGLPRLEIGTMGMGGVLEASVLDPLRELGIRFELRAAPWKQHWEGIDRGDYEFFRAGWIADYPDAENFFSVFYSRSTVNQTRYSSPEFDRAYERLRDLPVDDRGRAPLCSELERILRRDAPAAFLYHEKSFYLIHPAVRNLDPSLNPMERKYYEYVWLDPGHHS